MDIIAEPCSEVFYYICVCHGEIDDDTPGVCADAGDGTLSWSPVKLTRTGGRQ